MSLECTSMLASGGEDGTIILWEAAYGEKIRTLQGSSQRSVYCVAFSPSNLILATGSGDASIILWDPYSGRQRRVLTGHSSYVFALCFSPDGCILASGSGDTSIILWNPETGKGVRTLQGHTHNVWSLAFSPDGHILSSCSTDKSVILWDLASGRREQALQGHTGYVLSVAFSPDSTTVASGSEDRTIILWDATLRQERRQLLGHVNGVWSLAFSPDGSVLASGSADRSVILWDPVSGKQRQVLEGHASYVLSIAFSPDGWMLASGSDDKCIKRWKLLRSGWSVSAKLMSSTTTGSSVRSVAFSSHGKGFFANLPRGAHEGADTIRVPMGEIERVVCALDDDEHDRVTAFLLASRGTARAYVESQHRRQAQRLATAMQHVTALYTCAAEAIEDTARSLASIMLDRCYLIAAPEDDEQDSVVVGLGSNNSSRSGSGTSSSPDEGGRGEMLALDLLAFVGRSRKAAPIAAAGGGGGGGGARRVSWSAESPNESCVWDMEEEAKNIPLVAMRVISQQLLARVPPAIALVEAWLMRALQNVEWRAAALRTISSDKDMTATCVAENEARGNVASKLLGTAELVRSIADGAMMTLSASCTAAQHARDNTSAVLEQARKCLASAKGDEAATKDALHAACNMAVNLRETLPLISADDVRENQEHVCNAMLQELQRKVISTSAHSQRMQALVESLEQSLRRHQEILSQIEADLSGEQDSVVRAGDLLERQATVYADAETLLARQSPTYEQLDAICLQAHVALHEQEELVQFMQRQLGTARTGWTALQRILVDELHAREEAHVARIHSADLSAVTSDDLRTVLLARGLGKFHDQLVQAEVDGKMLAEMLDRSTLLLFAIKLEDYLEHAVGITDVCGRKRIVHVIQLIQFGLDFEAYSQPVGSGPDAPGATTQTGDVCRWTPDDVRYELRRCGIPVKTGQMEGVNGEVLVLLREDYRRLADLGISDPGAQRRAMAVLDELTRSCLLVKLRLGLVDPPRKIVQKVDDGTIKEVCSMLSAAMRGCSEACLVPLELAREWTDDFSSARLIGAGAFGKVYEGIVVECSKDKGGESAGLSLGPVAVKRLSIDYLLQGGEKHLKREINVLSNFKHPNIIRMLGYTSTNAKTQGMDVCVLYELGSRGSLSSNLKQDDKAVDLTWRVRVRIASGLAKALNYMHCFFPDGPVYHRDVKSDNVVLTTDLCPKLIDCGLALLTEGQGIRPAGTVATTSGHFMGTPGYMCPRYSQSGVFDAKSEVYSYAIVVLELITGRVHVGGSLSSCIEGEQAIEPDARLKTPWSNECLESLSSLTMQCLEKYGRRTESMMTVVRSLKSIEDAYCQPSEEEELHMRELQRLQRERDAGRADGVLVEKLRKQLLEQGKALAMLRADSWRAQEAREAEMQRERDMAKERYATCYVCLDDTIERGCGVSCALANHFICASCFNAEVREQTSPHNIGNFKKAGLRIKCRACTPKSVFFEGPEATKVLDEVSFSAYLKAREDVAIAEAMREQDNKHTEIIRGLEDRLAAVASGNEARVLRHRMRIIDEILTLKCPRKDCRAAFCDFEGCFALKCSACSCGFCAYCLMDCEADAHQHVTECPENIAPGRDIFAPTETFHLAQNRRRTRMLKQYIAKLVEPTVKGMLLEAIAQDLADLGIHPREVF